MPSLETGLFRELKRRNVFRVAAMYAVAAWLVIQIADATFEPLGVSDSAHRILILVVALGFPVALVLGWVFDWTAEGLVRTPDDPEQEVVRLRSSRRIDFAIIAVLALALGMSLFGPKMEFANDQADARASIRSIAVLPLENLTGDPTQAYFVEGMTEALIMGLARISSLHVTSRTTMLQYTGTTLSLPEIALELGVEALVEGSIMLDGDRVRITVQLIDARNDQHLWAEQFDRDLGDVLNLQSEVARNVARRVEARLSTRESEMLADAGPVDPRAQDAYLKGIYFANKHTPAGALRARRHFEEAMRLDPEYPLGYAGLADTLSCSPMHTWAIAGEGEDATPTAVMDLAWDLANQAIELDADLPEAQTALGLVRLFRSWDWDGAFEALNNAVEISPSYEFARRGRGLTLAYYGELDDAIRDADHALVIDPLNAQVIHQAGQIYEWSGDLERAEELYREATAVDSANPNGRHALGILLCKAGVAEQGIALLEESLRISAGDPLIAGDLGWCFATVGRSDDARSLLADLTERMALEWVSPIARARVHIGLGEKDEALAELGRAYNERAYRIVTLDVESRWDPIRARPRFQALRRAVGLRNQPAVRRS
jgi:adenylate cyclase